MGSAVEVFISGATVLRERVGYECPEFHLREEMAPRSGEPPRGLPRPAYPMGAPRPEGRQQCSGRELMSAPHTGATPDWVLTSRALGQGQQNRWEDKQAEWCRQSGSPGAGQPERSAGLD